MSYADALESYMIAEEGFFDKFKKKSQRPIPQSEMITNKKPGPGYTKMDPMNFAQELAPYISNSIGKGPSQERMIDNLVAQFQKDIDEQGFENIVSKITIAGGPALVMINTPESQFYFLFIYPTKDGKIRAINAPQAVQILNSKKLGNNYTEKGCDKK